VLLRAKLRNVRGGKKKVALRASVGGHAAHFAKVTVPAHSSTYAFAKVTMAHPRLWEPGHGRLYTVRAAASLGKRVVSTYSTHIGIRSFTVDRRGRLRINGRRFALRGASMHEDNPLVGAALSPLNRQQMFGQLLELGANITRAHYPLHPDFLEMADRAGVLVWDQIPFYRIPVDILKRKSVRNRGLSYLRDTILRDQNHPSVLAWSIANELSSRPKRNQQKYMNAAVRLIKSMDPTRLSAIDFAGYPSVRLIPSYRRFDALGMNSYAGWYPGPAGQIHDRQILGQYLNQLHQYYPQQALFVTEFGAEANRHGPVTEPGTFEYQSDLLRFHFQTYAQKSFVNGAIAWILRDFKVRPGWEGGNPFPTPPYVYNEKGLVDPYGQKKPAFAVAAALIHAAKARVR
jgi:beta-glucuronidase